MENTVIPIEPKPGLHPDNGRPVTVVGVDASAYPPKLIILVTGLEGLHAEAVAYVDNDVPRAA